MQGIENEMRIAAMTFRLHAPWVHSLKEKRMVIKNPVTKIYRILSMERCNVRRKQMDAS